MGSSERATAQPGIPALYRQVSLPVVGRQPRVKRLVPAVPFGVFRLCRLYRLWRLCDRALDAVDQVGRRPQLLGQHAFAGMTFKQDFELVVLPADGTVQCQVALFEGRSDERNGDDQSQSAQEPEEHRIAPAPQQSMRCSL